MNNINSCLHMRMKHIADYEDFDIPYGMVSKSYFVYVDGQIPQE